MIDNYVKQLETQFEGDGLLHRTILAVAASDVKHIPRLSTNKVFLPSALLANIYYHVKTERPWEDEDKVEVIS